MGLLLPISLSLNGLRSLTEVRLSDCCITDLQKSLGALSLLQELYLDKNNFARITESIKHLSKLEKLDLSYCARLQTLPELPCNLFYLEANPCTSLKAIPGSSSTSYNSLLVDLRNSFKLDPDEPCEILLKVEEVCLYFLAHSLYFMLGVNHFPLQTFARNIKTICNDVKY